jgi:hypothetical protein
MHRCVAHDLAAALVACVGRKSIFKDSDVIVRLGDFGFWLAGTRRTKRAMLGRRVIRAVLTPRGDRHPFFEKGMPAKLAIRRQELASQTSSEESRAAVGGADEGFGDPGGPDARRDRASQRAHR